MEFYQLHTFLIVTEEGSITGAARYAPRCWLPLMSCGKLPPRVSRHPSG